MTEIEKPRYIVPKSLYITVKQDNFFKVNALVFSTWVRNKIDIEIASMPDPIIKEVKTDGTPTQ